MCNASAAAVGAFWVGVTLQTRPNTVPDDLKPYALDIRVRTPLPARSGATEQNGGDTTDVTMTRNDHRSTSPLLDIPGLNKFTLSPELMDHCCQIAEMAYFQSQGNG